MNTVIDIAFPVFGLGILGYAATKLGYFSEKSAEGLARFVFDYAVPIMLLRTFANADLPDDMPWALLASFYIPAYGVYFLAMFLSRWFYRYDFMERVIAGLGCGFGNLALLGLPIALQLFGEQGALPYFIVLSLHGIGFFTVTTVLLEYGKNRDASLREMPGKVGYALITNPFIISALLGIVLSRTGTPIPDPVDKIFFYMQQAVIPCALFSLGASLTRYRIVGQLREPLLVVTTKNVVLPCLVAFFAIWVFKLSTVWTMVVILMAAQPSGVTLYLFSERYHTARALATTTVFLSSLVCMFTITLLLYLFESYGI